MALRNATADDYARIMQGPEPEFWVGMTITDSAGDPVALGCIYASVDGRYWVGFKGDSRALSMQRGARQFLAFAQEQGLELHAVANPAVHGSVKWIERNGFKPTNETINGEPVYKWTP